MSGGIALDALLASAKQNAAATAAPAAAVTPAATPAAVTAPAGGGALAGLLGAVPASPAAAPAVDMGGDPRAPVAFASPFDAVPSSDLGTALRVGDVIMMPVGTAAAALAASVSNPAERGLPAEALGTAATAHEPTLAAELTAPPDPTYADGSTDRKIATLYVDCFPEGQHCVFASDIVRAAAEELAAGGMQHWRCVDFGRGQGLLAMAVARRIRHADRVVLWTSSDAERACLDAFLAQAEAVVRGRS